jgi:RNA polymerase sigma-70 factor (ECF subfamily)
VADLDPQLEKELAKRVRSDVRAFEHLYEYYLPRIYRYVAYKTNSSREEIEDLTAAVFEKAWKCLDQFDWRKGAFGAWLYRIARNHLTDHFRTRKPAVLPLDERIASARVVDIAHVIERKAELQEVWRLLGHLGEQEQEILSLKFSSAYTNREIAGMLRLTESNIGVIVYRSLRKLRELVGGGGLLEEQGV